MMIYRYLENILKWMKGIENIGEKSGKIRSSAGVFWGQKGKLNFTKFKGQT